MPDPETKPAPRVRLLWKGEGTSNALPEIGAVPVGEIIEVDATLAVVITRASLATVTTELPTWPRDGAAKSTKVAAATPPAKAKERE